MNRRVVATVIIGLLGLVVAALLGYLALQLVNQPVGLSTIPPRAGDQLIGPRQDGPTSTNSDSTRPPAAQTPETPHLDAPTWSAPDDVGHDDPESHGDDKGKSDGDDHDD